MDFPIKDCMKLGFGLMRLPRNSSDEIDVEQVKKMIDVFFENGGRYFDTAFVYGGSEVATKKALVERYPRESYYLATKLNASSFACKNEEEAKQEFYTSLERLGTEYIDFYLLHALDTNNIPLYEKYHLWDYVKQLKAEGKVKHYGFSFHDQPEVLEKLLQDHPDVEFIQLQINYADWDDVIVKSRECYEIAEKYNVPVVVMEPVKGGTLAVPPDVVREVFEKADEKASPASWAVRFAASLPNVMVVLSGMSNLEQVEDNVSYMKDFKTLSDDEKQVVEEAREALKSIDSIKCTACRYCTPGCPMQISIPDVFRTINTLRRYPDDWRSKNFYAGLTTRSGKASDCIACGQCEGVCPQHLHIIDLLKEASEILDA